jgi:methionine sulfoxide reductase heme-binding subunit
VTDPSTHLFWITSRAAGTAAMVLAGASVTIGAVMGGRLVKRGARDRIPIHEALSLAVLVAVAIHGLSLLGDAYLRPSVFDISIPFVSGYKTGWTTAGIIAGWGLAALGLSYYVRARIGVSRWRVLHRFTALFWLAGVVHAVGEGTDAGQPWFLALMLLASVPALVALGLRWSRHAASRGGAGRVLSTPPNGEPA